jgi:hypothetical protein
MINAMLSPQAARRQGGHECALSVSRYTLSSFKNRDTTATATPASYGRLL